MAEILVTGGAGYIGSVLVPTLLRGGHRVTVVDNFMYGQASLLDVCHDPNLTIVRGDARDKRVMECAVWGKDILIPLAALVGAPLCARRPDDAISTNFESIRLLLSVRTADQKVIYPTTNSGYGIGEVDIACDEETPLKPISLYGRTKCDAEAAVLEGGNAVAFRLATVFGVSPRMRLDLLVNDFTYRAFTDSFLVVFEGHFKRNYIHVRDVAGAFCHAIGQFNAMRDQAFNVGLSSANLSKLELCEQIRQHLPHFYFTEATVGQDPDKRNYIVSSAKIEATGFHPRYSLDDGIEELIKAFQIIKRNEFSNV